MKIITDTKKIKEILKRGLAEVIVKEELEKKLLSGRRLKIKFGIDPTGSVLHLGHAVILRKLKEFQELGHQVIFLIGDFTARIGDPTGRASTRQPLTDKQIKDNMKNYARQAGLILDMKKVEVRYNSEWLEKLNYLEIAELANKVTFSQIMQRADFKKRLKNDQDMTLQEFMYPVMQGYDSVALKADVELGGTDQKFNLLMGRQLQKRYGQEPQEVIMCPILEGLNGGDKMSKSLGNYIALDEPAETMYGKVMSLTDDLIIKYFELAAATDLENLKALEKELARGGNPRDLKMRLALAITALYHGEKEAQAAENLFIKTVQKKEAPEAMAEVKTPDKLLLSALTTFYNGKKSKSDIKRLFEQGGISLNDAVVAKWDATVKSGDVVRAGKRDWFKIK